LEPEVLGRGPRRGDVFVEGRRAVDLGLAVAEQIEVRSGEQQYPPTCAHAGAPVSRCSISARVAITSSRSTPLTTSTPRGPSRTKVRSPLAFLSRAMNPT